MKYEIKNNEIVFHVKTERLGKWAFVDVLKQVEDFWEKIRFYEAFKRQPFDSINIEIIRTGPFHSSQNCPNCEGYGDIDIDTGPFKGTTTTCIICDGSGIIPRARPTCSENRRDE